MPEYDYTRQNGPVKIADGIFWVGFYDREDMLTCNPYLIVEGKEAILIDGGNRPDFSTVMLNILQTGTKPDMISHLIYHHYDPDLCGSVPHLEEVIGNKSLKIISHRHNNTFIRYYGTNLPRLCIESMGNEFRFATGRRLRFIRTPYAHSSGSFVTFDGKTGTLFSSDIFGTYGACSDRSLKLPPQCDTCKVNNNCPHLAAPCPLRRILDFHAGLMPSTSALRYALDAIRKLPLKLIAPQHGTIIDHTPDIEIIINKLYALEGVGIDQFQTTKEGSPHS